MLTVQPYIVILLIIGTKFFYKSTSDPFSPMVLFSAAWLGAIFLHSLNIVVYNPVSLTTWFFIVACYIGFAVSYSLSAVVYRKYRGRTEASKTHYTYLSVKRLFILVVVLSLFGTSSSVIGLFRALRTVPLEVILGGETSLGEFRDTYAFSSSGFLKLQNSLVAPFAYILLMYSKRTTIKFFSVFVLILSLFCQALSMSRLGVMRSIFFAIAAYYYIFNRIPRRALLRFSLCGLFLFLAILRVRSPHYGWDHRFYVRDGIVNLPASLSFLSTPIIYATAPIVTLDTILSKDREKSNTWESLIALRAIQSKLDPTLPRPDTKYKFYNTGKIWCNVATYLRHFVIDFGMFATILLVSLLGFLISTVYNHARSGHPHYYFAYLPLAWSLVASPFSNHFVLIATQISCVLFFLYSYYFIFRIKEARQNLRQ